MSDHEQPLNTRFAAFVDRNAERQRVRAAAAAAPADVGYQLPLERLYERFDDVATGRANAHGADLHAEVLARLAANRAHAEPAGWTACALERAGGTGRIRLTGIAPGASARSDVPDWTAGVDAASGVVRER